MDESRINQSHVIWVFGVRISILPVSFKDSLKSSDFLALGSPLQSTLLKTPCNNLTLPGLWGHWGPSLAQSWVWLAQLEA